MSINQKKKKLRNVLVRAKHHLLKLAMIIFFNSGFFLNSITSMIKPTNLLTYLLVA